MVSPPVRRKRLPRKDQLFNPLARKVLRKRIGWGEAAFGAVFVVFLAGAGLWIAAQKNRFDPRERDISYQALVDSSVKSGLYEAPLKRWHESDSESGGGAAAAEELGVLPRDVLNDGWRLDRPVETYDSSNLYEKIDGGAEQYLHFGFQRLHYATLSHGQDALTIELYESRQLPERPGHLLGPEGAGPEGRTRGRDGALSDARRVHRAFRPLLLQDRRE